MRLERLPFVRTTNELVDWLATARPAEFCIYHRGQLAANGECDNELTTLALAVSRRERGGAVRLFQKRIGRTPNGEEIGTIAYLAQKRSA